MVNGKTKLKSFLENNVGSTPQRENIKKLQDLYEVDLKVKQDKNVKQGKSKIEITKTYNDFLE